MNIIPEYPTTDLILATVLKENGNVLDKITTQGIKGIFYFLDVEKDFLVSYDTGKLLVEPVSFQNSLRSLTAAVRRQVQR